MRILLALLLVTLTQLTSANGPSTSPVVVYRSAYGYADTIDNLKMAITDRGLLISGTLHVSDMLNRTAPDLGYSEMFSKAESLEFCSALISHKMTQVAPENMAICPFTISVYIRNDEPEQVYVAFRRQFLAGDGETVADEIVTFMDELVKEATE